MSFAAKASLCRKQWFQVALGALSRILFTTSECFPVTAAALSVVTPTHPSQASPTEPRYISTVLKTASAVVVVGKSALKKELLLQVTIPDVSDRDH